MTLTLGLEEAGRGPVIGPMIICGYMIESKKITQLMSLGVKDSKLLTPQQRENLYKPLIKLSAGIKISIIHPQEIDTGGVAQYNLNQLTGVKMAEIINQLKPEKTIIDTPSNNKNGFAKFMKQYVNHECELKFEHKADVKYPIVSAASVIAKVVRDREIKKIEAKIGIRIGSGYPSDPITQQFLNKNWKQLNKLPFVRKSWATIDEIKKQHAQRTMKEFL